MLKTYVELLKAARFYVEKSVEIVENYGNFLEKRGVEKFRSLKKRTENAEKCHNPSEIAVTIMNILLHSTLA